MSVVLRVAVPTAVTPSYTVTVLPITAAVPSVAVLLKLTRTTGVESLVMLSPVVPVSDTVPVKVSDVGAAGGVVSSAVACAVVTALRLTAVSIVVSCVSIVVASAVEAVPSAAVITATSVKLMGVGAVGSPICVTILLITVAAVCVLVLPTAGASDARSTRVAI